LRFYNNQKYLKCLLLQICHGLTSLLYDLAHWTYGSVVLNDFQRQQFVLVDGDVMLSDVDDVGFEESRCRFDNDCRRELMTSHANVENVTLELVLGLSLLFKFI